MGLIQDYLSYSTLLVVQLLVYLNVFLRKITDGTDAQALFLAMALDSKKEFQVLLNAGVNPNAKNELAETALMCAMNLPYSNLFYVKTLLDKGARVECSIFVVT